MTDVLVRNVPYELAQSLRASAEDAHRSVQGEAATLLEQARRRASFRAMQQLSNDYGERNKGRYFRDSTLLIREDRDTGHGKWDFQHSVEEFAAVARSIRDGLRDTHFNDSSDLTREDRDHDHGHE